MAAIEEEKNAVEKEIQVEKQKVLKTGKELYYELTKEKKKTIL